MSRRQTLPLDHDDMLAGQSFPDAGTQAFSSAEPVPSL